MPEVLTYLFVPALVAFFVETAAYLLMLPWYYRLGPALHDERWKTSVSVEEAETALGVALQNLRPVVRRRRRLFLIRFGWWEISAWPRITISVSASAAGAVIAYQVRPFVTAAVFVIPCLVAFAIGRMQTWYALTIALIVASYPIFWWYELRRLKRLEPMRERLAHIGLQVCTKCGYDRFGLAAGARCPECGDRPGGADGDAAGG